MDADTASAQPKVDAQQPAAENKETSAMETAPKTEQAAAESAAADAKPEADAAADSETKKPADGDDAEMKDASAGAAETETTTVPLKAADDGEAAAPVTPAADKSKARRKSSGGTDTKKKLNRKGSKANLITHTDAKPGEYYFHQLKGHSPWPVVICDEEMLPEALLKTRPVSAARPDGTYREDHADGGKNVNGRKFPVMYLQTNEFGWALNTELRDLDPATVAEKVNAKMPKNLAFAHELAAEQHDLDHWKSELEDFAEKKRAMDEAAATSAKGSKKAKAFDPATDEEEEEDVEMADDADDAAAAKKSKKRKAEEAATPQRSDSVKKPKIKITSNSTPKTTNGATPKSSKPSESKTSKSKAKKDDKKSSKEQAPKEPELSPEERHQRKEKEVLFLRHKLQKGLLTRDQEPKEDEMKLMSDYITKLEGFQDLEVSIIRATKINKVLKGILKLSNIPKEAEFNFKTRSQALLDEWNKLLEGGDAAPAAGTTNGVNGKSPAPSKAASPKEKTDAPNGVTKEDTPKEAAKSEEAKDAPKKDEAEAKADTNVDAPKETSEKPEAPADATATAPEAVDAAA